MTTPADGSGRTDDAATMEKPDATTTAKTAREPKEKKSARSKAQPARITRELPAITLEPATDTSASPTPAPVHADAFLLDGDIDEGATREMPAMTNAEATASLGASDDPDATLMRPPLAADVADDGAPQPGPTTSRRFNTLAEAFNRSRSSSSGSGPFDRSATPADPITTPPATPADPVSTPPFYGAEPEMGEEILDEVDDDGEDEWTLADQPTVVWTPEQIAQMQAVKPDFLQDTGELASWPPREGVAPVEAESDYSHHDWRVGLPPRPRPPFPMQGASRPITASEQRLAAPDGRVAPLPPSASQAGAQPDPRMERFQELRRQRYEQGDNVGADSAPTGDVVKKWWSDLRPNLSEALTYQRDVRASGMHPIPAYVATPTSRLGDAFGRLAATALELSDRAQQAAAPTFKRIHNQVEQVAQAATNLMSRFEGDNVRQQAPLLGPGRIAVFFRQGVTVGHAQRLLAASAARPMRLIPRKHGFLARVEPGKEAEVCERLRQHPYVRDVAYLEYNEYGEVIGGRR